MKVEIKHTNGTVLYTAEIPDDTPTGSIVRCAAMQAVIAWADLSGADLRGANLRGANLNGETLTKSPLSLLNLQWDILITDGYMSIGCQRHTHAEWASFNDEQIKDMQDDALAFWEQWRGPLLAMCAAHAAG